jgi:CheY-like chemotaxis protein
MGKASNRASILVVEDEAMICDMVTEVLTEDGFEVHAFSNGDDALRYLAANGGVDLLFTDVNLPGSLDGSALARRARELRPSLPVVYASARDLDRRHTVPGSIFLAKPYSPTQMCSLLTRLVAVRH